MKNIFLLALLTITLPSLSNDKVVYGDDDRVDVFETKNADYIGWAKATAAKVNPSQLIDYNANQYKIAGKTLEDQGICKSQRFSQQPTVARCSGFLVSDKLLVTAGHCARKQSDCDGSKWVFDHKVGYSNQSEVIVDKSNVYGCKRIVSSAYNETTMDDYAVIELDGSVPGRTPLDFRIRTGKTGPFVGDKLVVIGHPSGLPTKIADGAWIRTINSNYFLANLDTFSGSSGSPVINVDTHQVEGILVRGETDYVFDDANNCKVVNKLANDAGEEGVTRITTVSGLPK